MTVVLRGLEMRDAVPLLLCDYHLCLASVRMGGVELRPGDTLGMVADVAPPRGWYSVLIETSAGKVSYDACGLRHATLLFTTRAPL